MIRERKYRISGNQEMGEREGSVLGEDSVVGATEEGLHGFLG